MTKTSNTTKKRLVFVFVVVVAVIIGLIVKLGYIQIVSGEELKKGALEQWTRGIEIKPKRGIIYDKNGKKLAVNISSYTVWANPADIEDKKGTAKKVAEILNLDENIVYEKLNKKVDAEKIKQWITKEEAKALRNAKLPGISVIDDNKRFYPYEDFAPYILGFTNIDNEGSYGVEKTYDKYLSGSPGRWVKTTDAKGRQMPYDGEKVIDAENGLNLVLTLDEVIQHLAEKAAKESVIATQAKNVSIIVMEPQTGDVLAMANLPHYNPNNPREPLDENKKQEWKDMPQEELQKEWFSMWRNYAISDVYEPGSTFKTIVAAAALEENVANVDTNFYCNGFIRDIPGALLKCSRWYNPHGPQTLKEGMDNSCNIVFVDLGRKLGKEKFYKYIKAFGFGETTGIELLGEQAGIIPRNTESIKEVNLATMSYGHGIAVTPIQLINAINAIANGGNLMKPRIASHLIDDEGNTVMENDVEVIRQVISKSTSATMMEMMESVVTNGTGISAYVPGYKVAGKTGTAQKIIDGRYAPGKYIGSFIGVAPASDPKISVLVIVDEPIGVYYGGSVAAPVAGKLIEEILDYMEIEPEFTEKEKEEFEYTVKVPDVRDKAIGEGGRILLENELKYTSESLNIKEDSKIVDQFPSPGMEVSKGSIVDLYLDEEFESKNKIILPDLIGKSKEEVIKILDGLGLKYHFIGEGRAIRQVPEGEAQVDKNSTIEVEFSAIKE